MTDLDHAAEQRRDHLAGMLAQPLNIKVQRAIATLTRFVMDRGGEDKVYISFSGGKDSTVLLHLTRMIFPNIKAVYCNTGLEFPMINDFVDKLQEEWGNIDIIKPKMSFKQVVEKFGYPAISKETSQRVRDFHTLRDTAKTKQLRFEQLKDTKWSPYLAEDAPRIGDRCCHKLKKEPFKAFEKEMGLSPITGVMAHESSLRKQQYIRNGCIAFSDGRHQAKPLSLWTDADIWEYIEKYNVPIADIYKEEGITRTGCIFCLYGLHIKQESQKLVVLKRLHPKMYEYVMSTLGAAKHIDFMVKNIKNVSFVPEVLEDVERIVSEPKPESSGS